MADERADLRRGVERRLEFIEFRLFWEGHVNRSDLISTFGISVQQASTDLNRYLGITPKNMIYDKSAKTYVRGPNFKPAFFQPDASHYLSQLKSISDGILEVSDVWVGMFPSYDTVPFPARGVDVTTLRTVVSAIRQSQAVEVKYQSLSQPESCWRWIAPHAIAFDGFRWHARSLCMVDKVFKDFLLSRILDIREIRQNDLVATDDNDWNNQVMLEIGPHPALSEMQSKVIALDYGMRDGKVQIKVRRALLYYALKRLGLDTDPSAREPYDQQIVLLNKDDLSLQSQRVDL